MWTDSTTLIVVTVIAAIPPTLAAFLTLREVGKVHILVNSQMTSVKADLVIANERIAGLMRKIEVLEQGR